MILPLGVTRTTRPSRSVFVIAFVRSFLLLAFSQDSVIAMIVLQVIEPNEQVQINLSSDETQNLYLNLYLFRVTQHDKEGLKESIRQPKTSYNYMKLIKLMSFGDSGCPIG